MVSLICPKVKDEELDIGTQIRNLIEQKGMTQKQLAQELHISTTTLNGYIQNRRQPDARMVMRIASYFKTSMDYIYEFKIPGEVFAVYCNEEERCLIDLYRGMPQELKPLFLDTGRTFEKAPEKRRTEFLQKNPH